MATGLERMSAGLLGWLTDDALPLWAEAGFDAVHGRFEERLTLRAERLPDIPIRLITQARQVHAYALAARRGWRSGGTALVEQAYAAMVRDYHGSDGRPGWAFSIRPDGIVADPRRDLYAHAFALLAIASYVGATGGRRALALADETLAFIDAHMAAPGDVGGFVEQLPPSAGPRRQNPHMHLFEALLALWECSGDARYLARAGTLFDLFAARFFRADSGALGEYFTAALDPAEGLSGRLAEPGHHYEWVWLLRRFEEASGRPTQLYVDALYSHADRHGSDSAGLVVDEILMDGSPHKRSRRTWPMTEAIKANLVEAQRGRRGAAAKAVRLAGRLRDHFLPSDPAGGWLDRLDPDGRCIATFMPASTLYHLVGAIDELERAAISVAGGAPRARATAYGR